MSALVHAGDFHVNRRGRAEIQDLCDDVRRLKEELHPGKKPRQLFAQIVDVGTGRLAAPFRQLHKNFRVGTPDGAGVAIGEVNTAVRQADIVEDGGEFVLRDDFTDDTVYLVGEARGFLDAQTGACAHVQANLPGVDLRKEIAAENADKQNGQNAKCQETRGEEHWRMQRDRKSTRLNSSHGYISYAVFCLKKKKHTDIRIIQPVAALMSGSHSTALPFFTIDRWVMLVYVCNHFANSPCLEACPTGYIIRTV